MGVTSDSNNKNLLLEDVKRWGNFVLKEAKEEIGRFYPEENGDIPVGYIWARTIPCQNPTCGVHDFRRGTQNGTFCCADIPLMRQFWLAKKDKKKVSLFPYIDDRKVKFKVVGDRYEPLPDNFKPEDGTVSRAIATCLCVVRWWMRIRREDCFKKEKFRRGWLR